MMKLILEIAILVLKAIFLIAKNKHDSDAQERKKLEERLKLISKLLKEAIDDKSDIINEADFLKNLEWEQKKRYETYRDICLKVLTAGGSIHELEKQDTMGMKDRIVKHKDEILKILDKVTDSYTKAVLIAKQLIV